MVSYESFQLCDVLYSLQICVCGCMYFFQIIVKTSEEQDLQNFLKGIDLRTSYLHKIKVKVEYALVF